MSGFAEKKAAVKRAAERELTLSMKIGDDPQIVGLFFDVNVEGKYLGWCSKSERDELQGIYDKTPSKLQRPWIPPKIDLSSAAVQVEFALAAAKRIEVEVATANPQAVDECLTDIRIRLELAYETILKLQTSQGQRT